MTTRIDKAFYDIEVMFKQIGEKNKEQFEAALIKPIHDKYPFAQNGICTMIASMGSGKSYNYLKFRAKQEIMKPDEPFYGLMVICLHHRSLIKLLKHLRQRLRKASM